MITSGLIYNERLIETGQYTAINMPLHHLARNGNTIAIGPRKNAPFSLVTQLPARIRLIVDCYWCQLRTVTYCAN